MNELKRSHQIQWTDVRNIPGFTPLTAPEAEQNIIIEMKNPRQGKFLKKNFKKISKNFKKLKEYSIYIYMIYCYYLCRYVLYR